MIQTTGLSALALTLAEQFGEQAVLAFAPKLITALQTDIASENPLKILRNEENALLLKVVTEIYVACGGTFPLTSKTV